MTSERMTEADQTTLLLSLQIEMIDLRRRNEEVSRKNEQEIQALRKKNEDMKRKLVEGGPSVVLNNLVSTSFTSPPNPRAVEETKDKAPLMRWMVSHVLTSRSARPIPWIWCIAPTPLY